MVFSGNTSTSAVSDSYNLPTKMVSLRIANKSGGGITINVSVLYGSTNVLISPYNKALAAADNFEINDEIFLQPDAQLYITTTGNIDYYASIDNYVLPKSIK